MNWREYTTCFVILTLLSTLVLFVILLVQGVLPLWDAFWDADHLTTSMAPDLAANVAVSFATTTMWQPYAGESTMSYATQMVGLAAQNFVAGVACQEEDSGGWQCHASSGVCRCEPQSSPGVRIAQGEQHTGVIYRIDGRIGA
jgi:hypothetical protein